MAGTAGSRLNEKKVQCSRLIGGGGGSEVAETVRSFKKKKQKQLEGGHPDIAERVGGCSEVEQLCRCSEVLNTVGSCVKVLNTVVATVGEVFGNG